MLRKKVRVVPPAQALPSPVGGAKGAARRGRVRKWVDHFYALDERFYERMETSRAFVFAAAVATEGVLLAMLVLFWTIPGDIPRKEALTVCLFLIGIGAALAARWR